MLLKGHRRCWLIIITAIILAFILIPFRGKQDGSALLQINQWLQDFTDFKGHSDSLPSASQAGPSVSSGPEPASETHEGHREIYSASTLDRKYFFIKFGNQQAINPNIIPHPSTQDTWIIVAQQKKSSVTNTGWHAELVCNAVFTNNTLACTDSPLILPIAATTGDKCEGDLAFFDLNIGPHDARVFYGPRIPFVLYGSNSINTCFGQYLQDFRVLVDWSFKIAEEKFRKATELQRPPPYRPVEKNWFIFWDKNEQLYAHFDIAPHRVFAKLEYDGSVGPNLALATSLTDEMCLTKYMPTAVQDPGSIHQATNSLSITLCQRSDPLCEVNDSNTFVMVIIQQKSFSSFHSVYEPYVMLFAQDAPFQLHAISQEPLWIHGRRILVENISVPSTSNVEDPLKSQSEMFYVTSFNWKVAGQKYHGYLDDILLLAFGVEDEQTAGIDVVAADLLQDLGLCLTS